MDYLRRLQYLTERDRFRELIPVVACDDDTKAFLIEGDAESNYIGSCWVAPPLGTCDAKQASQLESVLAHDFPAGTMIQVISVNSSYVDHVLHAYVRDWAEQKDGGNGLSADQVHALDRLLRGKLSHFESGKHTALIKENGVLLRDTGLVVSLKIPCQKSPSDQDMAALHDAACVIERGLTAAGLALERMDRLSYVALTRSILRMGQDVQKATDDSRLVRDEVVTKEDSVEVQPESLTVNGLVVRCLSTQTYPKNPSVGYMGNLLGDPMGGSSQICDPFLVNLAIYFPDREKVKQAIANQAYSRGSSDDARWARFTPRLRFTKTGVEALTEALDGGVAPVKVWLNVVTFSRTEDASRRTASSLKTHYQVHGFEMKEDRYMALNSLLNALPLCNSHGLVEASERYVSMPVRHAANIMPILGDWKGNGRLGSGLFVSRRGQVLSFDPFASVNNGNVLVAGGAGSGKTVWCHDFVVSALSKGGKVHVVSQGEAYKKLVMMLGGVITTTSGAHELHANPFSKVVLLDGEMAMLKCLVSEIAAPGKGLGDAELSEIKTAIRHLWSGAAREMSITSLALHLIHRGETEGRSALVDIGQKLISWEVGANASDGAERENPLLSGNNLALFNLDSRTLSPGHQAMAAIRLLADLQRAMQSADRSQRKYIVIDELEDLLMNPNVCSALGVLLAQAMECNCLVLIVARNLASLYRTPGGSAIAEMAASTLLFKPGLGDAEGLRRKGKVPVDAYGVTLMNSVYTMRGMFSEFFLHTEDGWGVGRLVLDRWTQLLYSTDLTEDALIMKHHTVTQCSIPEAVDWLLGEERKSQKVA